MVDRATLVYDIDSSQARTAASDLAKVQAAAVGMAAAWSKTDSALRKSNGQWAKSTDVVEKYGAEIKSLAAEFNPALNAVYQFQEAETRMNRAVALGVITLQQKETALEQYKTSIASAATAQQKFAKSTDVATHHATNLGYQLNDIGMMMSLGQNPFALMMQQGPQVAQIFSTMTAEGRKIGPTLASAFTSILNPTTLVVFAVIAGTAALVQWGMSALGAEKNTEDFATSLGNLKSAADNVNSATRLLSQEGLTDVYEAYGAINERVRQNVQLLTEAAIFNEMERIRTSAAALRDEMTGGWLTTDVDDLRILFDTTNDQARNLLRLFENIKSAKTFEEQAKAAAILRDEILTGGRGIEDFEGSARQAVIKVIEMADAAERLTVQVDRAKKLGEDFSNLDLSSGVSAAGDAALVLARNLNISLETARKIAAMGPQGQGDTAPQGRGDPREMGGSFFDWQTRDVDAFNKAWEKAQKDTGGGGGGGGGRAAAELKAAEKSFQSLRELLEQESLFEVAEYQKRQMQLDTALSKKLVSQQNYELMKSQLQTFYFGTEYEKQLLQYQMDQMALDLALEEKRISHERHAQEVQRINAMQSQATLGAYSTLFGNMANIVSAGGNKTTAAVKAFSIAQGLLNSYLAYTQVLADPALIGRPFLRTALAASTLASGLAQVSAMKGGGGGGSAASATASAAKVEPTRNVLVRLEGPDYLTDMAESIMTQIYEQTQNGRVVIARDNS